MSIEEIAEHRVMVLPETGEFVTTPDGMAELIGSLWGQSVTLVAVPRFRANASIPSSSAWLPGWPGSSCRSW
ncbi:hypothetical protein [Mycetocola saprophilus]|uniref:hypothetical protein n=1 Tax=Mycetocola saprophilus TaxID=76636 RepID=UPI003BEFD271